MKALGRACLLCSLSLLGLIGLRAVQAGPEGLQLEAWTIAPGGRMEGGGLILEAGVEPSTAGRSSASDRLLQSGYWTAALGRDLTPPPVREGGIFLPWLGKSASLSEPSEP